MGLNAGIMPAPGVSYINITLNYNAGAFNNSSGNPVPVTGSYNVWAVEDIFYFVPGQKISQGAKHRRHAIMFPTPATGSLAADIANPNFPNL